MGNSTELKNVILFDNVQVPHYNYVGDSILGYKSHMGAGAVTSNVKQDKSPVAVKIGFRSLETGLKKFGAMLGDQVESGLQQCAEPRHRGGERLPCVPAVHDAWVPAQRHDPQKHGGNRSAAGVGLSPLGMTLWERGKSLGIHRGISAIGVLPTVLLIVRILVPLLALYVVWRCYTSFKKGQRRRDPVIMLVDEASGARFPVLYWENSIGRSKSCDIYLPDATASRDHAVLLRRDEGWFICDTGSKSGVYVNGRKIDGRKLLNIGDKVTMGSTTLVLRNTDERPLERRRAFTGFSREAASPIKLMLTATFTLLLVALQGAFLGGEFHPEQLIPFGAVLIMGWGLYIFSIGVMHRVSFEVETVAYLLSGIGVQLLAAFDIEGITTQLARHAHGHFPVLLHDLVL